MLDELERLEQAATPGPCRVSLRLGGCEIVDGAGEWLAEFERAEDAEHYAAARNALPALLRVARAAERFAGLGLACEYTGEEPEPGEPDECPGIADGIGPCHWCEMRVALDALDRAGKGREGA